MVKLFRYLKPYRQSVILVLVLIFLQSLATLYLPNLMSNIVDLGIIKGNIPYIIKIGGFMLLVTLVGGVFAVSAGFFASKAAAGFGQILRSKVFSHVESFSLHEFDQFGTSSLIVRTNNDIMQVQQMVNMLLRMMVMAPLTAIGGIIMAVYTDASLSWIIVVVLPILSIAIYVVLGGGIGLFKVMQQKVDQLNRVLRENLMGIRIIRSFHRIDNELRRFDEANRNLTDTSIRVYKRMAALMPMMMFISNFATLAIVWFGGIRINDGTLQIGNLMAFIQYVMQIMFSVMMVSMMSFMIPRAEASAVRINEVLNTVPEIKDVKQGEIAEQGRGQMEFRNVTFSYPGAEEPAISDISFSAKCGEITAVIGGTGAGKSTLIQLIPRFYDPKSGSILVDGVDVREMSQANLRAKIGFVPQQATLFSGTIAENIRYGNQNSSDEDVQHAAEIAQATEFISNMKDGFDSIITQGGANISGGQKQRLSIARALVKRPEIYIFDDSFSALDFKTDAKLRAALKQEVSNSTVLIVAQRVITVMDADQIIVLDEGRIVGIGHHKELMDTCKVYREIVSSQLSEGEIA
ncbi:ABC transporter ATP-binding protein [Alicyclobacillaceae bacterium I2511]|nr:ABC transporter ATP-binding protein [Alicyclobacillaceae bacterium I2511]